MHRVIEKAVGPVFHTFYSDLNARVAAFSSQHPDTVVLYMTRAGTRLLELNDIFSGATAARPAASHKLFYVSRLAALKGCMRGQEDLVAGILASEYSSRYNMSDLLAGLGFRRGETEWPVDVAQPVSSAALMSLYRAESALGEALRNFFRQQAELFDGYVRTLLEGSRNVILVDSGWFGTTQMLLMKQFPDVRWLGCYYGKWRYKKPRPEHFDDIVGLCVDGDRHRAFGPRKLSLMNYHLVESLLEPEEPSVTGYRRDAAGEVVPEFDRDYEPPPGPVNPMYDELKAFLSRSPRAGDTARLPFPVRHLMYFTLARYAAFPRRAEVDSLVFDARSADMGKGEKNPLVFFPEESRGMSRAERYRKAIWKPGQMALELPLVVSAIMQFVYMIKFIKGMGK